MAVNTAFQNLKVKSCCLQRATSLVHVKSRLMSLQIRRLSVQFRRPNKTFFLKRFTPRYSQIGRYYEKPKERKGPSVRTWLSVGAGFIISGAGLVVYLGEYRVVSLLHKYIFHDYSKI